MKFKFEFMVEVPDRVTEMQVKSLAKQQIQQKLDNWDDMSSSDSSVTWEQVEGDAEPIWTCAFCGIEQPPELVFKPDDEDWNDARDDEIWEFSFFLTETLQTDDKRVCRSCADKHLDIGDKLPIIKPGHEEFLFRNQPKD